MATFKIKDGRSYFYQWDINREIIVEDSNITEVHFCNRADNCSLVVEVKDGIANVPNIILQNSFDVRVFGFDGQMTLYDEVFKVKARTRPADYVYTETELVRYEDLNKRMNALEENLESTVVEEVNKYMEENPVEVDLSDYYTKEEVDTAVENVEVDLTNYYTKTEVDTLISNTPSGGLTEEEVQEIVNNAGHSKYLNFSNLANPTDEEFENLKTIIRNEENINSYLFTVASEHRVLRVRRVDYANFLFVYGVFNGSTDTTIYGYQINPYTKTSTLLTSYALGSGGGLSQEEVQDLIDNTLAGLDGDEVVY